MRRRRGAPDADAPCAECPEPTVLPENVPPIELFCASQTQWRVGFGGATGLDYHGVEAAARLLGLAATPEVFRGVQAIESEFLAVLAERAKREEAERERAKHAAPHPARGRGR